MLSKKLPPLNSLVMFEAAARFRSFTIAAEELCVTQAAVSRQVRHLEDFLGNDLFVRTHRKLELTAIGTDYADRIREALIDISLATVDAGCTRQASRNRLRIVAGPCFSTFWLMPRLNRFQQLHPEIALSLTIDDHAEKCSASDYDLAFFYSTEPEGHSGWHRLFKERIFPVCSPGFLRRHGEILEVEQIWDYPLLMMENWVDNWETWETWARREGIEYRAPRSVLYLTEQTLIIEAAVRDCGIALAWDWHVQDLIREKKLVALYQPKSRRFGSFYLSESKMADSGLTRIFFSWVNDELAA
ncbi:LysR substrate-binding domain-containing protein [Desulforhopalus singaporensis]|uniref:DNA-binding transcriptional regulator, LysR family n=1 Tax=Desulforhopalus singaporensis TaxID=91360 RepID=A0A1H0RUV6_9BACT|nr:LysR substrate-binding domain-containing protein [Desulforhopalus singaporensis]SDP32756.1 DNA-binding transcriptional regulator, LysR family [Desulforhopalus singaporensis]